MRACSTAVRTASARRAAWTSTVERATFPATSFRRPRSTVSRAQERAASASDDSPVSAARRRAPCRVARGSSTRGTVMTTAWAAGTASARGPSHATAAADRTRQAVSPATTWAAVCA